MTDSSVTIRDARPGDAPAIARVHVRSWRTTYPGLIPAAFLVGLSESAAAARWEAIVRSRGPGRGALVATMGAEVVGFASYGAHRVPVADLAGEFYALYLLDEAQGRGIGRRLLGAMAERLLEAGTRSAAVWCLRDNPARWFYERLGGTRMAERPIRFAGRQLIEIGYGWRDLAPLARLSAGPEVG
ncbi:GNAT family N-acetyltransferase [Azospirillum thermophilum]|uniref:GNAT family N-acetyltransferase n=1 Tax=Azospirillum thermophilum TaxID=2202148 RepID=A0A2S2CX94_9PROT|nr:GNAT family N-acetyltransferase [Azospirillum thermophilum]AWK89020.1 GNAT family N-acetyltransferase [Azospirillum thermophilum]